MASWDASKITFLLRSGQNQLAEKTCRLALDRDPGDPTLRNLLGVCFHRRSAFREAVDEFRAAAPQPEASEGSLNLVATLCDLGCYDQAEKAHDLLTREGGGGGLRLARCYLEAARLNLTRRNPDEALQCALKAVRAAPHWVEAHRVVVWAYLRRGQVQRAHDHLRPYIGRVPDQAEAHNLMGLIHYLLGQRGSAKEAWEKARLLAPEDASASAYQEASHQWPA